jgi:hypothetical protein
MAHQLDCVNQAWNRLCDAWNTVLYASQILRVLQEEEDSSVELLCRRLFDNEPKLLQLGWMMVCDYYTSRELTQLVAAMIHNTSVNTISIGWSLRPYSIQTILGAVVDMPQVQNLSLVLHTPLDAQVLEPLKDHPNLKRLQVQNVQLRRRQQIESSSPIQNPCWWFSPRDLWIQDYNIVTMVCEWNHLDTLQLLDCDLQYPEAKWICCSANRRPTPWRELSVAYNPHIGTQGLVALLQTKIQRLDLTACNVTPPGARRLGQTLDQLTYAASPLESLCLARNVYMGPEAFPLITAACHRLLRLDVSYCQLPVSRIWQSIPQDGTLQHLVLQGYTDYPQLQDFLQRNLNNLKTLQLSSPSTSTPISASSKKELIEGMACNYYLEEVMVYLDTPAWQLDFSLQLNRMGRSILHDHAKDWSQVFNKASSNPECLYWLLRQGAGVWTAYCDR